MNVDGCDIQRHANRPVNLLLRGKWRYLYYHFKCGNACLYLILKPSDKKGRK